MATNWPNSVQTFTNPTASSALNSPSHADQHATVNDTVEALQNYAGLIFIKSQTIGTGVSSVTVTNAFDSRFDNYRVTMDTVSASAPGNWWEFQFTGYTSAGYYGYARGLNWLGGEDNAARNNSPSLLIGRTGNVSGENAISIDVFGPYKSAQRTGVAAVGGGYLSFVFGGGQLATNSSETAFIIKPTAGTMTAGTIRVYGYNNGA